MAMMDLANRKKMKGVSSRLYPEDKIQERAAFT